LKNFTAFAKLLSEIGHVGKYLRGKVVAANYSIRRKQKTFISHVTTA